MMSSVNLQLKRDIKTLIDKMGFYMLHDPEVSQEDERFLVSVFVDEPSRLIGERGANLRSLQSVFRKMISKKHGPEVLVDLDVNGYKKKRAELIRNMAHSARKKALRENKSIEMEPMNAYDRMLVHSALGDFEDVKTESAGEHPQRRVVVHIA